MASFIALFVGADTVIYNLERWSLIKQSVIHFLLMLITVNPVLLFSGWFKVYSVLDAFMILLLILGRGLVIWLIMFALAKMLPKNKKTK